MDRKKDEDREVIVNPFDIDNLIQVGLKRYKILIAFLLLGAISGFLINQFSPPYYTVKAIIGNELFLKKEFNILKEELEPQIKMGEISILQKKLNLEKRTVKSIKELRIRSISIGVAEITFSIYDNEKIPNVVQGLDYFLNNHEFVKSKIQREKRVLEETHKEIEEELQDLKSLKDSLSATLLSKSNEKRLVFSSRNIHSNIVDLKREKLEIEKELQAISRVHLIKKPSIPDKPSGPNYKLILLGLTLVGLFFGIFIAMVVEYFRN